MFHPISDRERGLKLTGMMKLELLCCSLSRLRDKKPFYSKVYVNFVTFWSKKEMSDIPYTNPPSFFSILLIFFWNQYSMQRVLLSCNSSACFFFRFLGVLVQTIKDTRCVREAVGRLSQYLPLHRDVESFILGRYWDDWVVEKRPDLYLAALQGQAGWLWHVATAEPCPIWDRHVAEQMARENAWNPGQLWFFFCFLKL